jgi:hypothetical protein
MTLPFVFPLKILSVFGGGFIVSTNIIVIIYNSYTSLIRPTFLTTYNLWAGWGSFAPLQLCVKPTPAIFCGLAGVVGRKVRREAQSAQ